MKGRLEQGKLLLSGVLTLEKIDLLVLLLREHMVETADKSGPVCVDLSDVTEVDTAALQVFVSAKRSVEQGGRSLELLAANAHVRGRFRLSGLDFLCR